MKITHLPKSFVLVGLLVSATAVSLCAAPVPPADRLLPPETLFLISAPDCAKLDEYYHKSPQSQFWVDPAVKPFRDKFMAKWNEEIVKPLERDLGIKFADYLALFRGQATLAVLQEGWQGTGEKDGLPGVVFLLDAREKADLLTKNLAAFRQKWAAAGKPVKTEKLRDVEFSVITLTTNDVPATIRKLLPQPQEIEEAGDDATPVAPTQIVMGQHESLLILATSTKGAEQVVTRLRATGAPTLGEAAEFEACRRQLFRDAPFIGWVNTKLVIDLATKSVVASRNPDAPSPFPLPDIGRMVSAMGLNGLKSLGFSFRDDGAGPMMEFFVSAPEAARTGLLKLFALEAKDAAPPAFVPATALKFSRVRLDGQKLVATLESLVNEISPQGLSTWNFLLNNANEAMRQEDPEFDIRKNIFGNLGDDLVTYQKAPKGNTLADLTAAPTLFLVGSPNSEKLAASLKGLLLFASPMGQKPETRELLGRKIYRFTPPGGTGGAGAAQTISYLASGGYVAFSTDEALLEEYLRSGESESKPLRAAPGFADAATRVGGLGTGWFNYENQSETMRAVMTALTTSASGTGENDLLGALLSSLPFANPEQEFKEWIDFSLWPSYDKIAKYYGFMVSAGQTSVNGISFKYFVPTPPGLKQASPP
jgi:hypothetical protein